MMRLEQLADEGADHIEHAITRKGDVTYVKAKRNYELTKAIKKRLKHDTRVLRLKLQQAKYDEALWDLLVLRAKIKEGLKDELVTDDEEEEDDIARFDEQVRAPNCESLQKDGNGVYNFLK